MLASLVPLAGLARADDAPPGFFTDCGTVRAFVPAGRTGPAVVTLGQKVYRVTGGPASLDLASLVGLDRCLSGSGDRDGSLYLNVVGGATPAPERMCGYSLPGRRERADTETIDLFPQPGGGIITLPVASGVALDPAPTTTNRRCYAVAIDRSTGNIVAMRRLDHFDVEGTERVAICGRVDAYRAATATRDGTVTFGSRTYGVAAGFVYFGDPAGDRTDRTTLRAAHCFHGQIDRNGRFTEYISGPYPTSVGGVANPYVPATPTRDGELFLGSWTRMRYVVPAGTRLGLKGTGSGGCFETGIDAAGDPVVIRQMSCPRGGVAAGPSPASPPPFDACQTPTALESAANADVVVHGIVVEAGPDAFGLDVRRVLHGTNVPARISVATPDALALAGTDRVLYLRRTASGAYQTATCMADHVGAPTVDELALLGEGSVPRVASAPATGLEPAALSTETQPAAAGVPLGAYVAGLLTLGALTGGLLLRWRARADRKV